MKLTRLILFLFLFSTSWSCNEKEEITACGVNDPINNLPWLNEIVTLADTDVTGNYWGTIWLTASEGQELIVTDMMLGSGGILYWIFDCNGEIAQLEDSRFTNSLSDDDIIYSNRPTNK